MKSAQIVEHLRAQLPRYTDLFTAKRGIASLTRAGATVTLTTATPHGRTAGEQSQITVVGAQAPVTVVNVVVAGGVATVTTASPHDLTEGFDMTFTLVGVHASLDGVRSPTTVPNRFKATFATAAANGTYPGGSLIDGASRGYGGSFLATFTGASTLTYTMVVVGSPPLSANVTGASVHYGMRISAGIDRLRLLEAYTSQTGDLDWWLFVIPSGASAAKDRHEQGDALKSGAPGVDVRQRILQRVEVMVVARSVNDIAARAPRDLMSDVRVALLKSILRKSFAVGLSTDGQNQMAYVEDDLLEYTGPVYAHLFVFEQSGDVTQDDVLPFDDHVAFRDVLSNIEPAQDGGDLGLSVNLDDAP